MAFMIQLMYIIEKNLTTFHWFQTILISNFNWIKKFFYNFICFIINHDFHVITFWIHYTLSSSLSMEEIKLFAIFNWIFHVSPFLRLFVMSFKYGLTLLRYHLTDGFHFYHHYFRTQYNCFSKNFLLLHA